MLDGDEARHKREQEEDRLAIEKEREEARKKVEQERGWTGKVGMRYALCSNPLSTLPQIQDTFDGGRHKQDQEEAEFSRLEQERQKHDGFAGRVCVQETF